MASTSILVVHWLIVLGLFARVIMRRPPIGVSMAWLAVISSAPIVGAVLYMLFGERRLGRRRAARTTAIIGHVMEWQSRLRAQFASTPARVEQAAEPLRRQAERVLGFPAMTGNEIQLLTDFQAVFDALIDDIDAAQRTCRMGFYIWHEGGRVEDVADALVRAAQRGVECQVLADAIGSAAFFRGDLARRLRDGGVELVAALPSGPVRAFLIRRDLRNHRKIVMVDDRVAYTGSQNLVDPRFFKQAAGVGEWVDAMVRVTGPTVLALDGVFGLDWAVETGSAFTPPLLETREPNKNHGSIVQVVPSGPDLRPEAIHQLLLSAIYAARRELVMTTPYFVPDDSILTALLSAALQGVDVTLIVPARNDSFLVRYASVAHFDELMSAGVKIQLYEAGLLHTKSLTVDGAISVFGSVNLDMRSLWLNFEISLFVYDPAFTGQLRSLQHAYVAQSRPLELEAWRRRSAARRFTENAIRLLGPLL